MASNKREYTEGEAQKRMKDLVDRVQGGEVIAIRRRGSVVAVLAPVGGPGGSGRRTLGGMRATATLHDDLVEPTGEAWDAG